MSQPGGPAGRQQQVRIGTDGPTLAGTLTLPPGDGPFPAALLLPGSGPVNRDSDHRRLQLGITRLLAEALTAAGAATLRYDKRGTGDTPGDWRRAGFRESADDAAAALGELRRRPEVAADRVVVVGHSEGALLATMLGGRGTGLAGLVLLSCSATPGAQLLLWQARRVLPTLPAPVRAVLRLTRTDLVAKVARNHQRITATTTDVARIGGARVNARWHREFLAYDPAQDLARITVPVLAVTGEKDLQVDAADVDRIASLVRGPVQAHRVPDVSHILRRQDGPASLRAYRREAREPLDPRVVALVTDWVTAVTLPVGPSGDRVGSPGPPAT